MGLDPGVSVVKNPLANAAEGQEFDPWFQEVTHSRDKSTQHARLKPECLRPMLSKRSHCRRSPRATTRVCT